MIRKLVTFIVVFLLILSFSGCGTGSFTVTLELQCDVEIYAVHIEYFIGETAIGEQKVSLTPENDVAYEKGAAPVFMISEADFPEGSNIKEFQITFYLVLEDGSEIEVGGLGIVASYGDSYRYAVYGNLEDGFVLRRG